MLIELDQNKELAPCPCELYTMESLFPTPLDYENMTRPYYGLIYLSADMMSYCKLLCPTIGSVGRKIS